MFGGFADHPTVLPIYFEMQRRSPNRMKKCLVFGFLVVLLLYIDIGFFGYFTFPNHIQSNLLSSNYRHNPVMLVTAAILCLYVISVVPLFAHAFRKSVAELMIERKERSKGKTSSMLLNDENGGGIINEQENERKSKEIESNETTSSRVNSLAPEARDIIEYPEDHIAFVPNVTPRTQKQFHFGQSKNQNEDSSDDTFESAESFELDKSNESGKNAAAAAAAAAILKDPFQLPTKLHAIVTLAFVSSALGVALFAPNIGTVNAFIGSTTLPIC